MINRLETYLLINQINPESLLLKINKLQLETPIYPYQAHTFPGNRVHLGLPNYFNVASLKLGLGTLCL